MKKRLKIGIVVDQMLAGGVQLAAIEQVKQLNKMGHEATLIILMRKKYPIDFSYLVHGVPHQYLSDSYPRFLRKTIKFPVFSFLSTLHLASPILAPKTLSKKDYDFLVSWGTTTSLTTQAIYRRLRIPYFAIIHDPIIYILDKVYSKTTLRFLFPILKPVAKFFEGSFVKDAEETILISKVHYNYLRESYGVRAKTLHLGVTPPKSIPKKRGKYLLSFGRWQREKNPQLLLSLIKKIPKVKLIIAGSWIDNAELAWFKRKVKGQGLLRRVEIISHFSDRELKIITSRARLFLHPHFEAFGLAALEAAAHGLPIVIPEKSGVTEKFTHGVHGFFPKKVDLEEYRKYVTKLINNERLAYKMGKAAANTVKKDYTWESNVKALLKIIDLRQRKKGPRIAVLETGHASESYLAGGDRVLEAMVIRMPDKYRFLIIVPSIGIKHWKQSGLDVAYQILPSSLFDNRQGPLSVFLAYLVRMWNSFWKLLSITSINIVYSSTNVLPDVLPAWFFKKTRPDVVWTAKIHHLVPPPSIRPGILAVNFVSYYFMQKLSLFALKNACDRIFVNSPLLLSKLAGLGFNREKMRILGGGIEYEKITQFQVRKKTKKYHGVYLGRLHPPKGIYDVVPIWKRVVSRVNKARLAVIGEGPPEVKAEFSRQIKGNGLSHNIDVLGFIPEKKLFSILKRADVFLFTDHEAGWGLAVAEAMACGLPVVGYRLPIFKDVYKQGFISVPKYNTNSFAKSTVSLLTNPTLRESLGNKAEKQAQALSWKTTAKTFLSYLEEIEDEFLNPKRTSRN